MYGYTSDKDIGHNRPLFLESRGEDPPLVGEVMGGPDPLVLSEDSKIPHYEELHPYKYLPSRSITHFSMFKDLERQDGSLYATTNADVWRDSSLRKVRG